MPCYSPISAIIDDFGESKKLHFFKKYSVRYITDDTKDHLIRVKCGQCLGCKIDKSREWALRCQHEIQTEAESGRGSCFITLTYNDDNLPHKRCPRNNSCVHWKEKRCKGVTGTLCKRDFQLFMKRLRKKLISTRITKKDLPYGSRIRYFHCGEYGDLLNRPHHHAILFGIDLTGMEHLKTERGNHYWTHKYLNEEWPYGYHIIGDANFQSSAYVARYLLKKITGEKAPDWYQGKIPEYNSMSRKDGIGRAFLEKYGTTDIYNNDICVVNDWTFVKPPKYYDSIYDLAYPEKMSIIKDKRKELMLDKKIQENNTTERLKVRRHCKAEKVKLLKREFAEL